MDEIRTLFEIPEANWAKFEKKIASLSKRSEKLIGLPITPFVMGYDFKESNGFKYKVFQVYFTAETPKVEGYTFVARLDHSQETGNIVRAVPNTGVQIPETFWKVAPNCDHCKINRKRRDTFLVCEEATGTFKQIGSSCLEDFFGHDPYKMAKMAELLGYALETASGYERGEFVMEDRRYVDLEEYLAHAAWAIRTFGWTSGAAAREYPNLISTRSRANQNMLHKYEEPSDEDVALAQASLEWARTQCEAPQVSDYMRNVCVIASSEVIEHRACGIAASIPYAYQRAMNRVQPRPTKVNVGDMTGILALFDKAKASSLRNPAIVLTTTDAAGRDTEVRLSVAGDRSQYPGTVNVTSLGSFDNRTWYGRIGKDGVFSPSRSQAPAGLTSTLEAFSADPETVAAEYGRKTGNCAFCFKPLKDARSTEVGYGQICAKRYGLKWGAKAKAA